MKVPSAMAAAAAGYSWAGIGESAPYDLSREFHVWESWRDWSHKFLTESKRAGTRHVHT